MASSNFEFFVLALNRVEAHGVSLHQKRETLHTAFCRIKNQYGQVFLNSVLFGVCEEWVIAGFRRTDRGQCRP